MFTTRPELAGTYGMVASTHWLASSVGMAVLELGSNAFDAVAAGLTLQVVEPHLNGPGDEVPIILHSSGRDETLVIGTNSLGGDIFSRLVYGAIFFAVLGFNLLGDGVREALDPRSYD